MDTQIHPGKRLRGAINEALDAANAYKRHHEQWYAEFSGRWKNDTRGHRNSAARFTAKMQKLDAAIDVLRELRSQ